MGITDTQAAMASWLGALSRSGVLRDSWDDAGEAVAAFVVGEPALQRLREWFAEQTSEVATRERRAAIEVCIWMAHADRRVDVEETHLLRQIIGASALDEDTQDALVAASHAPPSLAELEARLTHPVLRELLLALCWELATSDGGVDRNERDFYATLTKRLAVDEDRAVEIQRAIDERLT